jgi:hypothetical protein
VRQPTSVVNSADHRSSDRRQSLHPPPYQVKAKAQDRSSLWSPSSRGRLSTFTNPLLHEIVCVLPGSAQRPGRTVKPVDVIRQAVAVEHVPLDILARWPRAFLASGRGAGRGFRGSFGTRRTTPTTQAAAWITTTRWRCGEVSEGWRRHARRLSLGRGRQPEQRHSRCDGHQPLRRVRGIQHDRGAVLAEQQSAQGRRGPAGRLRDDEPVRLPLRGERHRADLLQQSERIPDRPFLGDLVAGDAEDRDRVN